MQNASGRVGALDSSAVNVLKPVINFVPATSGMQVLKFNL